MTVGAPGPETPYDVIIPLYNGGQTIDVVLDGLKRQIRPPARVIVVDDGSGDGAVERLRASGSCEIFRNPNKGANAARQFGLSQSTAPYVALLDQDDAPCPWHFDYLAAVLDADETCPAALSNEYEGAVREPKQAPSRRPITVPMDPWGGFPFFSRNPSALLIRRSALDEIGGWSSEYPGIADLYTILRLSERRPIAAVIGRSWWVVPRKDSYSTVLRRNNPSKYFDVRTRATEAAVAQRMIYYPDNRAFLEQRLGLQAALGRVLMVLEAEKDQTALRGAALALEDSLEPEPINIRRQACRNLFWYLAPLFDDPEWAPNLVHCLVDAWPNEAVWSKNYFRLAVAKRMRMIELLRYVALRPAWFGRWHLFAAGLAMHGRDWARSMAP